MLRPTAFAAVLYALRLSAPAAAATMFENGGFETGFSGWTISGNAEHGVASAGTPISGTALPGNFVSPRTGSFAAYAKLVASDPATTLSFTQTVDVVPGTEYWVRSSFGIFADNDSRATVRKTLIVNGIIYGTGTVQQLGTGYIDAASGWTVPPGVTSATITQTFSGNGPAGEMIGVSFDDFSIMPVPEPAGGAAIALAAGVLLRRHRRRLS